MVTIAEELGVDVRDLPAYSYAEGARMVDVPASTLRAWMRGQHYDSGREFFQPVLRAPEGYATGVSYYNLVEATVLRSLRTPPHRIPLEELRSALARAESDYNIERLFVHEDFRVSGKELFLEYYSELINLGRSDQIVLGAMLTDTLMRVNYDKDRYALSHHPLTHGSVRHDPKLIEIHPHIAFGRAIVASRGVTTRAIVSRIDAGETIEHIAEDYDITPEEIEEAQVFENRVRAAA